MFGCRWPLGSCPEIALSLPRGCRGWCKAQVLPPSQMPIPDALPTERSGTAQRPDCMPRGLFPTVPMNDLVRHVLPGASVSQSIKEEVPQGHPPVLTLQASEALRGIRCPHCTLPPSLAPGSWSSSSCRNDLRFEWTWQTAADLASGRPRGPSSESQVTPQEQLFASGAPRLAGG